MGILSHAINESSTLIDARIDEYGDQLSYGTQVVKCRFRYITELDRNVNAEAIGSDAIMWFEPDTNIAEGSIIFARGKYWRVDQLIIGRRLVDNTALFYKALVKRHQLAGES
jgi:hypothetical protein